MTTENFKSLTTEERLSFLNPLTDFASKMLLAGTLKKNVIKHFTNKGLSVEVANNLMELAEIKASQFSFYKFK